MEFFCLSQLTDCGGSDASSLSSALRTEEMIRAEQIHKLMKENDGLIPPGTDRGPLPEMPRIVHPDWYRLPRPDDDPRMIGDYPPVPNGSFQLRSPELGPYLDQTMRRPGEMLPEDYEILSVWSFDHESQYDGGYVFRAMLALFGGFGLFIYLFRNVHHSVMIPTVSIPASLSSGSLTILA